MSPTTMPRVFLIVLFLLFFSSSRAIAKKITYANYVNQFVSPQNAVRVALRLRPLVWDVKLEKYARWYANKRRYDCALKHSNGPYGENIFWGSGWNWTPSQAAKAWVTEKIWYNYRSNSCVGGQKCGHYTQIVWRGTRKIGCARVTCANGKGVFITCNYDPPGNFIGEKPY